MSGLHLNIPEWMVHSHNQEASRMGVSRQSFIKMRIAERLKKRTSKSWL